MRALLGAIPGIESEVLTFLGDRIRESISGETAAVVVNLFGDDLDALDAKAQEVAAVLAGVRGAIDVQVPSAGSSPRIAIRPRPERLARFGLRPAEVLDQIQIAYQGALVGQIASRQPGDRRRGGVRPGEPQPARQRSAALPIGGAQGARLPLGELADVREAGVATRSCTKAAAAARP